MATAYRLDKSVYIECTPTEAEKFAWNLLGYRIEAESEDAEEYSCHVLIHNMATVDDRLLLAITAQNAGVDLRYRPLP